MMQWARMDTFQAIAAERANIAKQRKLLDDREHELAITERVLRSLGNVTLPSGGEETSARPRRAGSQWQTVAEIIVANGGEIERAVLRERIEELRGPMTDNAYTTMLSKMGSAGQISRTGTTIRLPADGNDGGADVSLDL
jgi:hypothetical protein